MTTLIISLRGINEGRQCAREVDQYLMNSTQLPVTGGIVHRNANPVEILGRLERVPLRAVAVAST